MYNPVPSSGIVCLRLQPFVWWLLHRRPAFGAVTNSRWLDDLLLPTHENWNRCELRLIRRKYHCLLRLSSPGACLTSILRCLCRRFGRQNHGWWKIKGSRKVHIGEYQLLEKVYHHKGFRAFTKCAELLEKGKSLKACKILSPNHSISPKGGLLYRSPKEKKFQYIVNGKEATMVTPKEKRPFWKVTLS